MGNTCASIHIAWAGKVEDAAKAVVRCYGKLGYERVKKVPAPEDKHVILLTRADQSFVSVYDSDCAKLDNGDLKDLALTASKALKTATVFTSLYDSDTYEIILFANGKQVDFLIPDIENYDGPMKQLPEKTRSGKWSTLFGQALTASQIKQTLSVQSAFADDVIAGIASLIGLHGGQAQINFQDLIDEQEEFSAQLHFKKKPNLLSTPATGEIRLADYFDPDNCHMRTVYPRAWPMPVGSKQIGTWLALSQGAGFHGGKVAIRLAGSDPQLLSNAVISGFKFHNGQIVGALEPTSPPPTVEDMHKLIEAKTFKLMQADPISGQSAPFVGEFSHLVIPSNSRERTTQILIILQVYLEPHSASEWDLEVVLQPGTQSEYQHHLPPLRIVALEQKWLPIVSGLNPKTSYDKSNLSPTHLNELVLKQRDVLTQRLLDHPAVASSVAILQDDGQPTLDACKSWVETWLGPLAARQEGEIRVLAEKQMSATAYVGKTKKALPVSKFLEDKAWGKLFEAAGNYQTVLVSFVPNGAECAIAGIGLQRSFKTSEEKWKEDGEQRMARTLSTMRGRPFDSIPVGATWHAFKWVINHPDCLRRLETSVAVMEEQLDRFASEHLTLQAWSSQCTWIPMFDRADSYERTVYEEASVLNWFRGIHNDGSGLNDAKMTALWCRNVLRMVTPHMWLCKDLMDQLDRTSLERAAQIGESNGAFRIALRSGVALNELELALLPILPVESARLSVARR